MTVTLLPESVNTKTKQAHVLRDNKIRRGTVMKSRIVRFTGIRAKIKATTIFKLYLRRDN
jgi:hypothetical protein